MDIDSYLIKYGPESTVNIKSESKYDVSMVDIKTEKDLDIAKQINKTSGTSIKQELDDMLKINVKKEVHEVKEEPSSNDDVEENLPEIKTEEVMLKNEGENGDSQKGAHWKNRMKDSSITKHDGSLMKENFKKRLKIYIVAKLDKISIKMHACDICDFKTVQKGDLNRHKLAEHYKKLSIPSKKYSCYGCDYKTHEINLLKYHIYAMHSVNAVKKYECGYCKYRSFYESNLHHHQITRHNFLFQQ